ncbi:MAG: hypothetical protein ACK4G1_07655, partial [Ignavibacteria bacterium]
MDDPREIDISKFNSFRVNFLFLLEFYEFHSGFLYSTPSELYFFFMLELPEFHSGLLTFNSFGVVYF